MFDYLKIVDLIVKLRINLFNSELIDLNFYLHKASS